MNRYESASYLLGDVDVSLNENKQYKVEKRLDFVIEALKDIIKYTPLQECEGVEFADKMFEVESLIHQIKGDTLEEFDMSSIGLTGGILAGVGSMIGLVGAKTLINAWVDGKSIPTPLANLFFDIKQFIAGDSEKEKEAIEILRKKFPGASPDTLKRMVKNAEKLAPTKKTELPKGVGRYGTIDPGWAELRAKYQGK